MQILHIDTQRKGWSVVIYYYDGKIKSQFVDNTDFQKIYNDPYSVNVDTAQNIDWINLLKENPGTADPNFVDVIDSADIYVKFEPYMTVSEKRLAGYVLNATV